MEQYEIAKMVKGRDSKKEMKPYLEKAILMALLDRKYIDAWQYEQCCNKYGTRNVKEGGEIGCYKG